MAGYSKESILSQSSCKAKLKTKSVQIYEERASVCDG